MIKKVIMSLVLVGSAMTAQAASPAQHNTKLPLPDMVAIATANTLNRLGTVENFTKWISKRVPESEMSRLKANFPKMGLTPEMAFPTVTAKGNKVFFDKETFFTVMNKKSIKMNGKTFSMSDKTYDVLVQDIYDTLVKTKTTSVSLFIPEAHALNQQATFGLVGMALGAGLGYFVGPSLGVDSATGAVAGASVLGLGGLFLGAEDQSWITNLNLNGNGSNNGQAADITCFNGGYRVCNNSGGSYFGNNNQCQIMSGQSAAQYGRLPYCQPSGIPGYQQTYTNMNNNYYPVRQGPPAGAVQVTQ